MEGGTPGSSAVLVLPWGEGVGHLLGLGWGGPTGSVGGLPVLGWAWEGSCESLPGWKVALLTGNKVSSAPRELPDLCVFCRCPEQGLVPVALCSPFPVAQDLFGVGQLRASLLPASVPTPELFQAFQRVSGTE